MTPARTYRKYCNGLVQGKWGLLVLIIPAAFLKHHVFSAICFWQMASNTSIPMSLSCNREETIQRTLVNEWRMVPRSGSYSERLIIFHLFWISNMAQRWYKTIQYSLRNTHKQWVEDRCYTEQHGPFSMLLESYRDWLLIASYLHVNVLPFGFSRNVPIHCNAKQNLSDWMSDKTKWLSFMDSYCI